MEENGIKVVWSAILGWITSYFVVIYDWWLAISILWAANFAFGYVAGVILNKESLNKKKALISVLELLIFLVITALFLIIGRLMCKEGEILSGINVATWVFIWYFSSGILKNWSRLFPRLWPIKYLYFLISFEFANRLPMWKDYTNHTKKPKGWTNR